MCSVSLHARTKRANQNEYGRQLPSNISKLREICCKGHFHIGNNSWEEFLFIQRLFAARKTYTADLLFVLFEFLPQRLQTSRSGYFYVTLCWAITARNKVILAQTFTTFENPIFHGEKRVLCRKLYHLPTT